MRVLDKESVVTSLDKLGLSDADRDRFEHACHETHGAVLVTGPTGSGKSTTLYAALQMLNTPEKNIITVEDPVEYEMEGLTQLQVDCEDRSDVRRRVALDGARRPRRDHGGGDPRRARPRGSQWSRRSPATSCSRPCTPTTRPRRSRA